MSKTYKITLETRELMKKVRRGPKGRGRPNMVMKDRSQYTRIKKVKDWDDEE